MLTCVPRSVISQCHYKKRSTSLDHLFIEEEEEAEHSPRYQHICAVVQKALTYLTSFVEISEGGGFGFAFLALQVLVISSFLQLRYKLMRTGLFVAS